MCVRVWARVCVYVLDCLAQTTNYQSAGALGLYISLVGFESTTCGSYNHRSTNDTKRTCVVQHYFFSILLNKRVEHVGLYISPVGFEPTTYGS